MRRLAFGRSWFSQNDFHLPALQHKAHAGPHAGHAFRFITAQHDEEGRSARNSALQSHMDSQCMTCTSPHVSSTRLRRSPWWPSWAYWRIPSPSIVFNERDVRESVCRCNVTVAVKIAVFLWIYVSQDPHSQSLGLIMTLSLFDTLSKQRLFNRRLSSRCMISTSSLRYQATNLSYDGLSQKFGIG